MLKVLGRVEEFNSLLHQPHESILIKFATSWCRPCHQLQTNINKILAERTDLLVVEVDAEKFSELAQRPEFRVQSVPALFLFRDGKMIKENRGYLNTEELRE